MTPLFADRRDAGRRLAAELAQRVLTDPVVYALPRGGVGVAAPVAEALGAPLDVLLVRKLGVPAQPELAFGAVVDGGEIETVLNDDVMDGAGVTLGQLEAVRGRELAEIERRRALYFGDRPPTDPRNRDAIVVDDGLATGATARAALLALKRRGAARVILAVPVGPAETVAAMTDDADEVICLERPAPFWGVAAWYDDFHQMSDAEVVAALDAAAVRSGKSAPAKPVS